MKILLILFSFICFQLIGYCESSGKPNLSQKIYWGGSSPSAVAAQANRGGALGNPNSPDAEPMLFNPLGAYGSMLQMMNPYNSYAGIEQQKQNIDYVKQQASE